jgi:hypothetical protein
MACKNCGCRCTSDENLCDECMIEYIETHEEAESIVNDLLGGNNANNRRDSLSSKKS